jgi:hypothetical protein
MMPLFVFILVRVKILLPCKVAHNSEVFEFGYSFGSAEIKIVLPNFYALLGGIREYIAHSFDDGGLDLGPRLTACEDYPAVLSSWLAERDFWNDIAVDVEAQFSWQAPEGAGCMCIGTHRVSWGDKGQFSIGMFQHREVGEGISDLEWMRLCKRVALLAARYGPTNAISKVSKHPRPVKHRHL